MTHSVAALARATGLRYAVAIRLVRQGVIRASRFPRGHYRILPEDFAQAVRRYGKRSAPL